MAAVLLVAIAMTSDLVAAEGPKEAVVYYNQACGHCMIYLQEEIIPILREVGVTEIVSRDYINEPANRTALLKESDRKTNELLKVASVPATVVMGFIVGLCTFPCSGGIYVSIITLLNAKTTLAWGLGYLTLYNVLFVLPLIGILLAAGNRDTAKAWARWEREHALRIRLWYGIVMVALGAMMLIWVI